MVSLQAVFTYPFHHANLQILTIIDACEIFIFMY